MNGLTQFKLSIKRRLTQASLKSSNKVGHAIYHCTIQKAASQWFVKFFNDPVFSSDLELSLFDPQLNYLKFDKEKEVKKLNNIPPKNIIVSPLYCSNHGFTKMIKAPNFVAFYVIRDPRDLLVSDYFSLKETHPVISKFIQDRRQELESLSKEEGIQMLLESHFESRFMNILEQWVSNPNPNIHIIKFEEFPGAFSQKTLTEFLSKIKLNLTSDQIDHLCKKYSFKTIQKNQGGHYRQGKHGDWKNHLNSDHIKFFKEKYGESLIQMGYEKDHNW